MNDKQIEFLMDLESEGNYILGSSIYDKEGNVIDNFDLKEFKKI